MKLLFFIAFIIATSILFGQKPDSIKVQKKAKMKALFMDTNERVVDVSGYLANKSGFIPMPLIITEPALGYGGGLALSFFHPQKELKKWKADKESLPPSVTAVGGFGTSNKTWGVFLGHKGSQLNDHLRFTIGTGFINVNMNFYSLGNLELSKGFAISIISIPGILNLLFKVPKTPLLVGMNYRLFYNDITFTNLPDSLNDFIKKFLPKQLFSGLGFNLEVDLRDNIISPTKGFYFKTQGTFYDESIASAANFSELKTSVSGFIPVVKGRFFIGLHGSLNNSFNDIPFYFRPFINLRGIPLARYQALNALTFDSEYRVVVYKRWSLVGFIGAGNAFNDWGNVQLKEFKVSGGLGFRYLMAKLFNLQGGIDVARGPENWGLYFVIGYRWGGGF